MTDLTTFIVPPELVRYLTSKAGVRKAFQLLEFVTLWGMAYEALGRPIDREDFQEYWGESRATYYRRLQTWRAVWPDDESPQRVWEWCEAARRSGTASGTVPA